MKLTQLLQKGWWAGRLVVPFLDVFLLCARVSSIPNCEYASLLSEYIPGFDSDSKSQEEVATDFHFYNLA